MSARSKRKTTVAVLRQLLGLSVEEFARLIDKSSTTINSLETGRLKLSEETAFKIWQETGVEMAWLLGGNPKEMPWTVDDIGNPIPFTKDVFEEVQAYREKRMAFRPGKPSDYIIGAINGARTWINIYQKARENGKQDLATYLMKRFLEGLSERLGQASDEEVLELNRKLKIIDAGGREWWFKIFDEGYGPCLLLTSRSQYVYKGPPPAKT